MYLWIKALHLIFVISWFAGLFYIFRLFVYHVKFKDQSDCCHAYEIMESKLLNIIMKPAMILTFILGGLLIYLNPQVLDRGWFYGKLAGIVLLVGYQILSEITRRRFLKRDFFLSEKACRLINEVPTLALFIIILLVVLKP